MKNKENGARRQLSPSFVTGAIALAFLITGYQTALFIHDSARLKILAGRDAPDTVYVYENPVSLCSEDAGSTEVPHKRKRIVRHNAPHASRVENIRSSRPPRKVESFPFDPNTATLSDFVRMGFSQKQAQSILNYRAKGGRFRRKRDFAKSYVVTDSVYNRLEPYISIPKVDINAADTALLRSLPGIGKYLAAKIVDYRKRLGGFSFPEQLMEIRYIDPERYSGFEDLITVGLSDAYGLWSLPSDSLSRHPYIGERQARGIVVYREHNPVSEWTVQKLADSGVISPESAEKLSRCRMASP